MTDKKDEAEIEKTAETSKEVEEPQELEATEVESEAGGGEVPSSDQAETEAPQKAEQEAAEEVEAEVEEKEAESTEPAVQKEEGEPESSGPEPRQAPVYASGVGLMQRRKSFSQGSVPNAHKGYNPKTPVVMLGIIAVFLIASFILAALTT